MLLSVSTILAMLRRRTRPLWVGFALLKREEGRRTAQAINRFQRVDFPASQPDETAAGRLIFCLSGFGISAFPYRRLLKYLAGRGIAGVAQSIAGHDGGYRSLMLTPYLLWWRSAKRSFRPYVMRKGQRVFLCGYSTGALLCVLLAALYGRRVSGVVLIAPAVLLKKRLENCVLAVLFVLFHLLLLLPVVKWLGTGELHSSYLLFWLGAAACFGPARRRVLSGEEMGEPRGYRLQPRYQWMPVLAASNVVPYQLLAWLFAPLVTAPVLICYGARDRRIAAASVELLRRRLTRSKVEVLILERSGHCIPLSRERREFVEAVESFINTHAAPPSEPRPGLSATNGVRERI